MAWMGVVLLCAAVVAGAAGYVLSTREPAEYKPVSLDASRQVQVAQEFISHRVVDGIGNRVEEGQPFSWSIRAEACNDILASLDEIAYQLDGRGERERPIELAMREQGISAPAVSFQNGRITLMIFSDAYRRVLSVDIALSLDEGGKFRASLDGARVGRLAIPASLVRDELATLKQTLADDTASPEPTGQMISPEDFARVLYQVLGALDGETVDPVFVWPGNKRNVRITALRLADNELTIQFTPL